MAQSRLLDLLIATTNRGKVIEIQQVLRNTPVRLRTLAQFQNISPAEEVGSTYEENASLKALSYATQTGICALADDSGLEVDCLDGQPGIRSARFGGENMSDQQRTERLLSVLEQHPDQERSARFVSCLALAGWPLSEAPNNNADPRLLYVCEGWCEGQIINEPRGTNGFGYDPVFIPTGYDRTFAELPSDVKNVISHRAQALEAMRQFLDRWIA